MVADLAGITKIYEYIALAEQLKDIDIAMLFLNAGWNSLGLFTDLKPEEIEYQINLNLLHPTYLCKALLPQMLSR